MTKTFSPVEFVCNNFYSATMVIETARLGVSATDAEGLSREECEALQAYCVELCIGMAEDLFGKASGAWLGADWTHENGADDEGPVYCTGSSEGCATCAAAEESAGFAQDQGEAAIAAARKGDWERAAKAAREAARAEGEWGDNPTWGAFADHLEAVAGL